MVLASINSLTMSHDNKYLILASDHGAIKVFNLSDTPTLNYSFDYAHQGKQSNEAY